MNKAEEFYKEWCIEAGKGKLIALGIEEQESIDFAEAYKDHCVNDISDANIKKFLKKFLTIYFDCCIDDNQDEDKTIDNFIKENKLLKQ